MTWLTSPLLWLEVIVLALVCWCIYQFSKRSAGRKAVLRDWLAYTAIGVGLVVIIFVAAVYGPKKSPIDAKWIAFAANTVFVFGYALKIAWPLRTKPKFWLVVIGLVLMHGMIGWAAFSRVERVPLVWYIPADIAEIWVALIAIQWACRAPLPPMNKPSC
jgi:hypothetical protein